MDVKDPWNQYRDVVENSKKKIRIGRDKLELPELADYLKSLAIDLRDGDMDQHAALLHREIADAHLARRLKGGSNVRPNEERNQERKSRLLAAQLTALSCEEEHTDDDPLMMEYASDVENLYSKSIELTIQLKGFKLAGLIALEAASATSRFGHQRATQGAFLEKAIRLLEGELYLQSRAFIQLSLLLLCDQKWQHLLALFDDLCTACLKANHNKSELCMELLRECEIAMIFLIRKMNLTQLVGRHKLIHRMYATDMQKSIEKCEGMDVISWKTPADSALSFSAFCTVKMLLNMYSKGNFERALSLMEKEHIKRDLPSFATRLISTLLSE